jgi:hypothetical protein
MVGIGAELGDKPRVSDVVFVTDYQNNERIDILFSEISVDIIPSVMDFMHDIGGYLGRSGAIGDLRTRSMAIDSP